MSGTVVRWEKLPGHNRNEALDCRNYARAAMKIINPDFDSISDMLLSVNAKVATKPQARRARVKRKTKTQDFLNNLPFSANNA